MIKNIDTGINRVPKLLFLIVEKDMYPKVDTIINFNIVRRFKTAVYIATLLLMVIVIGKFHDFGNLDIIERKI